MNAHDFSPCHAKNIVSYVLRSDVIDDENNLYDSILMGMGVIYMPQGEGNVSFAVTSTTLHLIHSRGLYEWLNHEDSC